MSHDYVLMGRIAGVYGIKGYVKIQSYTRPKQNLLSYSVWILYLDGEYRKMKLVDARRHGQGLIAQFENISDRDVARRFIDAEIHISRENLPELAEGEYYWHDLIGMVVENLQGVVLGELIEIRETGANDVFVVQDHTTGNIQRLIPWVSGSYLDRIDIESGKIVVDWQKDYDQ